MNENEFGTHYRLETPLKALGSQSIVPRKAPLSNPGVLEMANGTLNPTHKRGSPPLGGGGTCL